MIDEDLKRESMRKKEAQRREVKVMLLGQAESGKSTLQKQFQLFYASQTLDHERPSWRPVVYFNVIKAIRVILDELESEGALSPPSESISESSSVIQIGLPISTGDLRAKLLPLIAIEDTLASNLNGGVSIAGGRTGVYVRAGWQALVMPTRSFELPDLRNASFDTKATAVAQVTDLAARTLASLLEEIEDLWQHPAVRRLLQLRKLFLDEAAPFFLDNIRRLVEPDYIPTTDDLLNVRLQTLGIAEHRYHITLGGDRYSWLMYDVGGARGMRHAWVPYFDDATAIIFLAPISAFDQLLFLSVPILVPGRRPADKQNR
jgi:guanine nucleotide-binding protein subunit alpha